jgi:hypothetical protein
MNALAVTMAVVTLCGSSSGQGVFIFNNTGGNGSPIVPVYGPEADNPHKQNWGNPTNASPPGTQVYSGAPLGTNYYAEAWFSLDPVADVFALNEETIS